MTFKGGSITLTTDSNNILSGLELYDGTTLLASAADPGPGATATWSTYTLAVPAGTSKVLTVKGVLPANPAASSQLKLDMPATTGLTGIDSNGTARNNGATGAVAGNTQRVYTIAPTFAYSTSGYTVSGSNPNGGHPNDLGSASISFTVTANGGDIYIATTTTITDSIGPAAPTSSDAWSCNTPGETTTNANFWRIPNGNTATCTFTDQITNTGGTAGWFQPTLTNISWMTSATTTGDIDQNWGLTTLKTSQFYLGI